MSNYPDNFCSKAFEARWGSATDEQFREEAKKVLPEALKEFIEKFNSRHDLDVSKEALDYAVSCLAEVAEDMYNNYVPKHVRLNNQIAAQNRMAANSSGEAFLAALNADTFAAMMEAI